MTMQTEVHGLDRTLNRRKRRPTHPGAVLREDIMSHLKLNQVQLAELLNVSRQTINEIVTEKRSITMDMAYRLGRLFGMDASTWLRMQEAVDAWEILQKNRREYEKIKPIVK